MSRVQESMQEALVICLWGLLGVIGFLFARLYDIVRDGQEMLLMLMNQQDRPFPAASAPNPNSSEELCYTSEHEPMTSRVVESMCSIGQKRKWYAVVIGYQPGIYKTWEECEQQVLGFSGNKFKSFKTKTEAVSYLQEGLARVHGKSL